MTISKYQLDNSLNANFHRGRMDTQYRDSYEHFKGLLTHANALRQFHANGISADTCRGEYVHTALAEAIAELNVRWPNFSAWSDSLKREGMDLSILTYTP